MKAQPLAPLFFFTLAGFAFGAPPAPAPRKSNDAIQSAQTPVPVPEKRVEQQLTVHDRAAIYKDTEAPADSTVFKSQPDEGSMKGFDFMRDPRNAKRPMQAPEEITAEDKAMKPQVMEAQRRLLEQRYDLTPKFDPEVKMSRGKPLAVGPTAKLGGRLSWEDLGKMTPEEIKKGGVFPYPPFPHPIRAVAFKRLSETRSENLRRSRFRLLGFWQLSPWILSHIARRRPLFLSAILD